MRNFRDKIFMFYLFYFILFIDCMQAVRLMAVYIIYRRVFPLHFRLTFQDFPHFILLWGVPPPVSFWLAPPKFYSTSPSSPPPGSKSWMSHWSSHSSSSFPSFPRRPIRVSFRKRSKCSISSPLVSMRFASFLSSLSEM